MLSCTESKIAKEEEVMYRKPEQSIPYMSQVDFEDRFRVLMGVPLEGEGFVVYKD